MDRIVIRDVFGKPLEKEGQIGSAEVYGYERDGSWSRYGGEGWVPCLRYAIRWKRKRNWVWLMKSNIISVNGKEI